MIKDNITRSDLSADGNEVLIVVGFRVRKLCRNIDLRNLGIIPPDSSKDDNRVELEFFINNRVIELSNAGLRLSWFEDFGRVFKSSARKLFEPHKNERFSGFELNSGWRLKLDLYEFGSNIFNGNLYAISGSLVVGGLQKSDCELRRPAVGVKAKFIVRGVVDGAGVELSVVEGDPSDVAVEVVASSQKVQDKDTVGFVDGLFVDEEVIIYFFFLCVIVLPRHSFEVGEHLRLICKCQAVIYCFLDPLIVSG